MMKFMETNNNVVYVHRLMLGLIFLYYVYYFTNYMRILLIRHHCLVFSLHMCIYFCICETECVMSQCLDCTLVL